MKTARKIIALVILATTLVAVGYWFWDFRIREWSDAEVAAWRAETAQQIQEKARERHGEERLEYLGESSDLGSHNDVIGSRLLMPYAGMLLLLLIGVNLTLVIWPWPRREAGISAKRSSSI